MDLQSQSEMEYKDGSGRREEFGRVRGRSSSRSRSRSWSDSRSRSRSRSRSWDRYRERRRWRRYSRSRSKERRSRWDHDQYRRIYGNDRSRDRRDERDRRSDEDSRVLMLRNLRDITVKDDIARAFGEDISFVRDIRLVQRKGSNSFSFVEFYDSGNALRWTEQLKSTPLYIHGSLVDVKFSHHQSDWKDRFTEGHRDWVCFKCNTMNFGRRRFCMTCDCSRIDSDNLHENVRMGRGSDIKDEDNAPSNVLIIKGLDQQSTEHSVRVAIAGLNCPCLPRDVRLIRDHYSSASRGFCFVEFNTSEDASTVLHKMLEQTPAFFVDGRRISVTYARQNSSGVKAKGATNVACAAIAQAQWSMGVQIKGADLSQTAHQAQYSSAPVASLHSSAAAPLAPTLSQDPQQQSVYQAYQPGGATHTPSTVITVQATSTASEPQTTDTSQQKGDYPSTYSYDPTSGFYYDSATGLYYDPKTQYHYNSETGHYCYYDSAQQSYISVDSEGNPIPPATSPSSSTVPSSTSAETKKTVPAVPVGGSISAKKIAKDMERWAKSVNAAKAVQKQQLQALIQLERAETAVQSQETEQQQPQQFSSITAVKRSGIALAAVLQQEDDAEKANLSTHAADVGDVPKVKAASNPLPPGADPDPSHTNWSQLACLVCKRKFQSKEVLIKHQQFSDLHKQNLEKLKKPLVVVQDAPSPPPAPASEVQEESKYRDRAKERRDKYGTPAIVPGWKKRLEREKEKAAYSTYYEQPTVQGLKEDNLGNKMLQAMGWKEGQGLGKSKQGIVEPIKAQMRQAGSGLGAAESSFGLYSSSGNYKETLRQLTKSRFESTFQN